MKKYVVILSALLALCSCTKKEVEVTYDHPLDAEFGANTTHKTDAVLYADFSLKSAEEIDSVLTASPSDLALLQLPLTVGTDEIDAWLESKRSTHGYSNITVVKETSIAFAALSNLNTATFDTYQMAESKALQVKYGDYFFLVAAPSENDITYVANNIAKTSDDDVLFFFQMASGSDLIEGMVYTDCIEAQYGDGAIPGRTDFLYAAPGVLNKIGAISLNPVRFTIFSEEK